MLRDMNLFWQCEYVARMWCIVSAADRLSVINPRDGMARTGWNWQSSKYTHTHLSKSYSVDKGEYTNGYKTFIHA